MNKNRVILITGASRGIGRHLAQYFLAHNAHVIGCSRTKSGPSAIKNYCHFCIDVSDEAAVKRMFGQIRKDYHSLDVLINNAGVLSINHALLTPVDTVRSVMDTNFTGLFLMCREAIKLMQEKRYGRIINISSIATHIYSPGLSIYGASKAAVEYFSQVLAKEVAPFGITVNVLGLSLVKEGTMLEKLPKSAIEKTLSRTKSKNILNTKDVAKCIDRIISIKNNATGQILCMDYAAVKTADFVKTI
jgi:3-oxoacyl-[acyl-carrier protein] reductase